MLSDIGIQVYEGLQHFVQTGSLLEVVEWFQPDAWMVRRTWFSTERPAIFEASYGFEFMGPWEPVSSNLLFTTWKRPMRHIN